MLGVTDDDILSGFSSVEHILALRLSKLRAEIAATERHIGGQIQRRDRLYKERDAAITALNAIGAETDA